MTFLKHLKTCLQDSNRFWDVRSKKSTAQITDLYNKNSLLGKQIIAVVNFMPKQVANTISECLILGFETQEGVVLLQPELAAVNGMSVK